MIQTNNIVILDDQDHAFKQVIYEFPTINKNNLLFRHFNTIKAFREEKLQDIFLVFLDFFFDEDRAYGISLIPEIECEHLICFSSMKAMSDSMYKKAIETENSQIKYVYSVQKIKERIANDELREVLNKIFTTH